MTALCNQPEAFASDLGDEQSRYLFISVNYSNVIGRVKLTKISVHWMYLYAHVNNSDDIDVLNHRFVKIDNFVASVQT